MRAGVREESSMKSWGLWGSPIHWVGQMVDGVEPLFQPTRAGAGSAGDIPTKSTIHHLLIILEK